MYNINDNFHFNCLVLNSVLIGTANLNKNPLILRLKSKLIVEDSTILGLYLKKNLNQIDYKKEKIQNQYLQNKFMGLVPSDIKKKLSDSWTFLRDYKSVPGIYLFEYCTDFYLGSTKNLYQRCFLEHKNHALTNTKKHAKFYNRVVELGWNKFSLAILQLVPNHVTVFAEKNVDYTLKDKDIKMLQYLTAYELTVLEQTYLDLYQPNLNSSLLANWSTYNKGGSGRIRTQEFKDRLSLSHLNRSFSEDTIELHRKNNLGKIMSISARKKMSESRGGVKVKLVDINSNNSIVIYPNKSLVAKELKISLRTVSRWMEDGKIHLTKSNKHPKVKLLLVID